MPIESQGNLVSGSSRWTWQKPLRAARRVLGAASTAAASRVLGAAVGGAVGGMPGVALGGAAGSLAASTLQRVGKEIDARLLSPREQQRVGEVFRLAVEQIRQRLERGDQLRSDGFFKADPAGRRPAAEELLEGILLVTQREYQERKLPYLANLFANLAFDTNIPPTYAVMLVKIAEDLTFRELILLELFSRPHRIALRSGDYRGSPSLQHGLIELMYESLYLHHRGYVAMPGDTMLGPSDLNPEKMQTQGAGLVLRELMGLSALWERDADEVSEVGRLLSRDT